jgi:hypothetical protein
VDGLASSDGVRRTIAPPKHRTVLKHKVPQDNALITKCCSSECWRKIQHKTVVKLRQRARECCISRTDKRAFFAKFVSRNSSKVGRLACNVKGTATCRSFIVQAVGGSNKILDNIRHGKGSR